MLQTLNVSDIREFLIKKLTYNSASQQLDYSGLNVLSQLVGKFQGQDFKVIVFVSPFSSVISYKAEYVRIRLVLILNFFSGPPFRSVPKIKKKIISKG